MGNLFGLGNGPPANESPADGPPAKRRRTLLEAGSKTELGETLLVGRVKRLVDSRTPAFGFLTPESGGVDLYFNEDLLSEKQTWKEFVQIVKEYDPGKAPVLYVSNEFRGRLRAKGIFAIDNEEMKHLDEDHDGVVSERELTDFIAARPELKDASRTKREREFLRAREERQEQEEEHEAEAEARDKLFKRQEAAEDSLYKLRDDETEKAKAIFEEGNRLWSMGEKNAARELHAEAKQHQQSARDYKRQAVALDWENNEEMFEYVQTTEHEGRSRDGTWIDLHGLSADFAVHKTRETLEKAEASDAKHVEIITGAGKHSGKSGPVVKPRIYALLRQQGFKFTEDTVGSVIVTLS